MVLQSVVILPDTVVYGCELLIGVVDHEQPYLGWWIHWPELSWWCWRVWLIANFIGDDVLAWANGVFIGFMVDYYH